MYIVFAATVIAHIPKKKKRDTAAPIRLPRLAGDNIPNTLSTIHASAVAPSCTPLPENNTQ